MEGILKKIDNRKKRKKCCKTIVQKKKKKKLETLEFCFLLVIGVSIGNKGVYMKKRIGVDGERDTK